MEKAVAVRSTRDVRISGARALVEGRCFCGARAVEVTIDHRTGEKVGRCSKHREARAKTHAERVVELDAVERGYRS